MPNGIQHTLDLNLPTHNVRKSPSSEASLNLSDIAAMHYVQCKDWKKACELAGFSKSYINGRLYQDKADPNSSLHMALNRVVNSGLSELKAKYLSVVSNWAEFDTKLSEQCASLPKEQTLTANPKVGNAVSRAMKFLRPELDDQQTIQHVTYQLAIGQMYQDCRTQIAQVKQDADDDE